MIIDPARCPLCSEPNDCQLAAGRTKCWCFEAAVPRDIREQVPVEARDAACICRRCATGTTEEALRRRLALRWTKRG